MTRKRFLITGGLVAWAAVLLGLAIWVSRSDLATVREHSDLAEAEAAMDAAVETLESAAGPNATLELALRERASCRISLARGGTELDQLLTFTVPEEAEAHLLERLAQEVPEDWQARFNPNSLRLSADAGAFVRVVGEPGEPGQVEVTLATGCRPS